MQRLRLSSSVSLTSDIFYKTFFFPLKLFVSTTKPQKQKLVLHKLFAIDHLLCWDVRWNATEALRGQLEGEHNFKSLVLNFLNPRDNTII